jgi:hypothetical protein
MINPKQLRMTVQKRSGSRRRERLLENLKAHFRECKDKVIGNKQRASGYKVNLMGIRKAYLDL